MEDTFITAPRNKLQRNASSSSHINENECDKTSEAFPGMKNVREKHVELHQVIGTLSEKIGTLLGKQERDFLAAYRAHMFSIQKELHELRRQLQCKETDENKTEKEKKLEEERDCFRKEAVRLDEITSTMSRDLNHVKEKLAITEKDRDWNEKRLKKYKMKNKILTAALESRSVSADSVDGQMLTLYKDEKVHCICSASRNCNKGAKTQKYGDTQQAGAQTSSKTESNRIRECTESSQLKINRNCMKQKNLDLAVLRHKELSQGKGSKDRLQDRSFSAQIVKNNGLHSKKVDYHNSETTMCSIREFYLQCVQRVKEGENRTTHSSKAGKDKKVPAFENNSGTAALSELIDFPVSQRIRVMEILLSNDEVLRHMQNNFLESNVTIQTLGSASPILAPCTVAQKPSNTRSTGHSAGAVRKPAGSGASVVTARNYGLPLNDSSRSYLNIK
ncbi:hypothetical protein ABG067_003936 [Albugo candida]